MNRRGCADARIDQGEDWRSIMTDKRTSRNAVKDPLSTDELQGHEATRVGNESSETSGSQTDLQDAVAERAYGRYLARGREDVHDLDDWLQSEQDIRMWADEQRSVNRER